MNVIIIPSSQVRKQHTECAAWHGIYFKQSNDKPTPCSTKTRTNELFYDNT